MCLGVFEPVFLKVLTTRRQTNTRNKVVIDVSWWCMVPVGSTSANTGFCVPLECSEICSCCTVGWLCLKYSGLHAKSGTKSWEH